MKSRLSQSIAAVAMAVSLGQATPAYPADAMTFFVTSVGLGDGANLGGIAGADRHCQALAGKAGAGARTWRAYLSVQSNERETTVNARDRIGAGPWVNARGEVIAASLAELHGPANNLNRATALTEAGTAVPGALHDILTGTRLDGTAPSPLDPDMTCRNWTSSADAGAAIVGHHDRVSALDEAWARSWNSAHLTRGCSQMRLSELGSGGLFYCFAREPSQSVDRP
jgi:hypothetical protein